MNWYIKVMKNYIVFKGRASRQEFWMFSLFNVFVAMIVDIISAFLLDEIHGPGATIYLLFTLLPWLTVSVRRLHDTGRSGWWCWIGLLPVIGQIVLLIFMCQASQKHDNEHDLTAEVSATKVSATKVWIRWNPRILIPLGVVMQSISLAFEFDILIALGSVLMMVGFAAFASQRLRSKFWCLLSYVVFFGLIVLPALQHLTTGKTVISDDENLSFEHERSFLSFRQSWFTWNWMPVLWLTLFGGSIVLSAFIDGKTSPDVFILLAIALWVIYFGLTRLVNHTSVNINSTHIDVSYGPLPWRKSYHASSSEIVSIYVKYRSFKRPTIKTFANKNRFPGLFALIEEHTAYHEVWIRTGLGSHKILSFREPQHALALMNTMKQTMNITVDETDLIKKELSAPPKSGRFDSL